MPAERRANLAVGVALAALTALVFVEALRPDRIFYYRDIANYWYPQTEAFVRSVAEGSWPVWNPSFSFGQPMLADPNYQIAYPLRWLSLVLLPSTDFKVFVLLHCWLAGAGLYAFARTARLTRPAAFLGAAVWCLSGPFLSTASLFHIYTGAAWIGWTLLALARTLASRTALAALGLGAILALQVAAGSGEILLMTAALGLGYTAFHLAPGRNWREPRVYGILAVAATFGALLSAVQWLPTLAYLGSSRRAALPSSENLSWSVHPASLVDLLVPRLATELPWGQPVRELLFEGREPLLGTLYLGMPAAGLVALAFLRARHHRSLVSWSGLLLLFFLLTALGRHAFLAPLLLESRLVALFRFPVKALIAAAVPWAILAGAGLQVWLQPWTDRERRRGIVVTLFMGALAAGAWVLYDQLQSGALSSVLDVAPRSTAAIVSAGNRLLAAGAMAAGTGFLFYLRSCRAEPNRWVTAALALLTLGDLAVAGRGANDLAPAELLNIRPGMLDVLGPPLDHKRVYGVLDPPGSRTKELIRVPADWKPQWSVALGYQEMPWGPLACRWRLDGSFDGDPNGLTPEPIPRLSSLAHFTQDPEMARRLLTVGAVEYVVGKTPPRAAGLEPIASLPSVYSKPIKVYRVTNPLPRAYVVGGAQVASGPDGLALLVSPAFDPRTEVILDEGRAVVVPVGFSGQARILSRTSSRVVLEVEASHHGYAVLVESYVPGWWASLDGAPAPVLRANAAFRALRVPPGRHRIEMWYLPRSVVAGAIMSVTAALAALGFLSTRRQDFPSPGNIPQKPRQRASGGGSKGVGSPFGRSRMTSVRP